MIEEATIAPRAERETILIVEDDLGIATLERRCLGRQGYGVVCATNAEDALSRIDEGGIGLVVLDHGLPGGTTGLELYERMKASGRDLPVVMVTGQSNEETVVEALRLGVRDFITKSPDYLDYLPGAVEAAVAQSRLKGRLEESEERFRGLIENLQVGVVLAGPDGEVLVSNRAALNLLGVEVDRLLGKHRFETCWNGAIREDGSPFPAGELPHLRAIAGGWPVHNAVVGVPRPAANDRAWLLVSAEPQLAPDGSVRQVICTISDVTERKALEEQLAYRAYHDVLTELPNRALFLDRLQNALAGGRRRDDHVAVLFVDLDNFKIVNDSLGHEVGDRLLVEVAGRLENSLRPADTLARLGGDEFAVMLKNVSGIRDVLVVVGRLLERLEAPVALQGEEVTVTASIGVALAASGDASPADLMREADAAMYRTKRSGRAGYSVFDPSLHAEALRRLELESHLRRAVEKEEFTLHYQPIVNLRSGDVWGMEALIRWEHPDRGLVFPSQFVPLAEETGLVIPMGRWVLREACRQAREWQQGGAGLPGPIVLANLSANQLRGVDIVQSVEQMLAGAYLDVCHLALDITETALLKAAEERDGVLARLREMGVRISIDDFGTGYSSLSYLKHLPADILKIDKSFVGGLGENVEDTAIVRMVIDLAHTLGMEVIAEGVESAGQLARLEEMGCDMAQGYYFARPLPPEAASRLLERGSFAALATGAQDPPAGPRPAGWPSESTDAAKTPAPPRC